MLININTNGIYNRQIQTTNRYTKIDRETNSSFINNSEFVNLPLHVYVSNINFRANPEHQYLLKYSGVLKCAYSGRKMITPTKLYEIFHSIEKQQKPNVSSGVKVLNQYQSCMHTIESEIFDIFKDSQNDTKHNFQDILLDLAPESLKRLKEKQTKILNSANSIINSLTDRELAEEIIKIRDTYLAKIENDEFLRKGPLDSIDNIMQKRNINVPKTQNAIDSQEFLQEINQRYKEYEALDNIYKAWYLLPSASVDFDAFVIKYSKRTHEQIAKALIEPSVATIEHIIPSARNGKDNLSNYILVCSDYNKHRGTLSLSKYIDLRKMLDIPETQNIEKHLQNYVNDIIRLSKKGEFKEHLSYAIDVAKSILDETEGRIELDTKKTYEISKKIKQEKQSYQKLFSNGKYTPKKS